MPGRPRPLLVRLPPGQPGRARSGAACVDCASLLAERREAAAGGQVILRVEVRMPRPLSYRPGISEPADLMCRSSA